MTTQEERNWRRYVALVREVQDTVGRAEALPIIHRLGPIAKRSIARAEQEWALEKYRWERGEST
jgi:hypothetical protein